MERKKTIKILKQWIYKISQPIEEQLGWVEGYVTKEDMEAFEMAINSLETDEAYQLEYERTTKNDLGFREFQEIVVEYPPEDLCTYPEYKGKPYFGIKYKENGEEIVGYGTYNPEVLSQYLKNYFISTTKNDLGVDCISRESVLELLNDYRDKHFENCKEYPVNYGTLLDILRWIRNLPSVTPQEPCDKCEVGNPCLYCKHEFESQKSEDKA